MIHGIENWELTERPQSARRKSEFLPHRTEKCNLLVLNTYYVLGTQIVSKNTKVTNLVIFLKQCTV